MPHFTSSRHNMTSLPARLPSLPVQLTQRETLLALFDNHTWSKHLEDDHFDHSDHSVAWKHPQANVFVTLTISFITKVRINVSNEYFNSLLNKAQRLKSNVCVQFFMSAVAISMPVPCGAFVPAFVIGEWVHVHAENQVLKISASFSVIKCLWN